MQKAVASGDVATCQYSSGLQVSGLVTDILTDGRGQPAYLRTTGPTALAVANVQLPGHGRDYHREGFGSPVGLARGAAQPIETMAARMAAAGMAGGSVARIFMCAPSYSPNTFRICSQ